MMKKLMAFVTKMLKGQSGVWLLVCVLLCILVWFLAPYSVRIREVVIVTIIALWVLFHFKEEIKAYLWSHIKVHPLQLETEGVIDRTEKRLIQKDFKRLRRFLRKQHRQDLPWILVMGDVSAGKTSVLREAELHILYQSYNHAHLRGKTFQWTLAEEGLFIDVPAQLCWQKEAQARFNFLAFVKALKKARGRRSVNGVVVCVNVKELAASRVVDFQESMRARLNELQDRIGMRLPLYLMMTHVDALPGFMQFVMRFTEQERQEILGLTFDEDKDALDQFPFLYDELIRAINQRAGRDLEQYYFPMQMAALREKLLEFSKALFSEKYYTESPHWRGLYFVSNGFTSQERYDLVLDEGFLESVELPRTLRHQRFFIGEIFSNVLARDAQSMGLSGRAARYSHWVERSQCGAVIGIAMILTALWSLSVVKHVEYDQEVVNLRGSSLSSLFLLYHDGGHGPGSWPLHLGLWETPSIEHSISVEYQSRLHAQFLPQLMATLQSGLSASIANLNSAGPNNMLALENLYHYLSAYLMMGDVSHRDPAQIENLLNPSFSNEESAYLHDLLQFGFPNQAINSSLVADAQAQLWKSPIDMQAYLWLKLLANSRNQEPLSLSENSLSAVSVPYFFTAKGYQNFYQKESMNSLKTVESQSWVLGPQSMQSLSASDGNADLQSQMDELYWEDYMNAWSDALSQINVTAFNSLETAGDSLNTLADPKNSPFVSIVNTLNQNTSVNAALAAHYQALSAGMGPFLTSIAAVQQYVSGIANSSNPQLSAYTAATQIFAGQADKSLITLSGEAQTLPAPLSNWASEIVNDSYAVIFASAKQYLATQWQAEVGSYYQQTLAGRFPFVRSEDEASLQDFSNYFKAGGVEDNFVKKYLSPFLSFDSFGRAGWAEVNNIPFSADESVPNEVSEAAVIRSTFFGGNNGALNFTISPGNLSGVHKVQLAYDGKTILFNGDSSPGVSLEWPPQNTDGTVTLTFQRLILSDETQNFMGPWGLFHLLQNSTLIASKYGNSDQVSFRQGGMVVEFNISTSSSHNPFDLKLLQSYAFPKNF